MKFDGETFRIRQSWLSTATRCPEQGRLQIVHPDVDVTTDEAFIGTATHAGIEAHVNGEAHTLDEVRDAVVQHYHLDPDGELANIKMTKRDSVEEMIDYSTRLADAWWYDLKPIAPLEGALAEVDFDVQAFVYRGYGVNLTGTVDLAPAGPFLWDWKTAGRAYQQKGKQKWAIQPTFYAWAAVLGGVRQDVDYAWPVEFTYGVMEKRVGRCKASTTTVQRRPEHTNWIRYKIEHFIDLYLDFGIDRPWTMIDEDNFLCSETWCPFYEQCRGHFIPKETDLYGWNP